MNKSLYVFLNANKDKLYDELDKAIIMKNKYSLDDNEIGCKLTCLTREKIFKQLINIFKLIRHSKTDEANKEIYYVSKRIKLHLYQMTLAEQPNVMENRVYFVNLLKTLLSIIIKIDIKRN